MICYLFAGFFSLQWNLSESTPQAINMWSRGMTNTGAEGVPFHGSLNGGCCRTQAPCRSYSHSIDSHLKAGVVWNVLLGEKRGARCSLNSAQRRHLLFCEKLCVLRVLGRGRNCPPGPEQLGSCAKERHRAHLLGWTGRVCSHDNSRVLLGGLFLLLVMLLFYFCFDNWSQGQPGFGVLFFLIGEIQIKLNKWTPDVGYILERLKKGKRPQRGWTWFLGSLYMTQGQGSEHLRFVKPKSDNTWNYCKRFFTFVLVSLKSFFNPDFPWLALSWSRGGHCSL